MMFFSLSGQAVFYLLRWRSSGTLVQYWDDYPAEV